MYNSPRLESIIDSLAQSSMRQGGREEEASSEVAIIPMNSIDEKVAVNKREAEEMEEKREEETMETTTTTPRKRRKVTAETASNSDSAEEVEEEEEDEDEEGEKTSTADSDTEVEVTPKKLTAEEMPTPAPPALPSHATNSIIESIRTNFFEQQQQQLQNSSALREQLLQQTTSTPSSQLLHPSQGHFPASSSVSSPQLPQLPSSLAAVSSPSPPLDQSENNQTGSGNNGNGQVRVTNVYRGLYPIKNVKQYFKKKTIDKGKLYICLWPECNFQTLKYSQHISRHIYLKHIGIKELKCSEPGCEKVFKRPESLVQHVKNHICGFGIDPVRMKDAANICGVKNIKRHFSKIMDNDIQVFMCQVKRCSFVTNNSGSIRRHVHNQHICPHSSTGAGGGGNNGNGSSNGSGGPRASTPSSRSNGSEVMTPAETAIGSGRHLTASPQPNLPYFSAGQQFASSNGPPSSASSVNSAQDQEDEDQDGGAGCSTHLDPLVVLTEYEGQTYDPVARSINHEVSTLNYTDYAAPNSPMDLSGPSMRGLSIPASLNRIDEDEDEEAEEEEEEEMGEEDDSVSPHNQRGGLFGTLPPLNSFGGPTSAAAAALNMRNYLLEQHHQQQQQQLLMNRDMASLPQPVSQLLNAEAEAEAAAAAAAAARRKNNGLYSLKNYKDHYYKIKTEEAGVQFICKGCQFQAKSQITLIRHLWNELGYKEFHCEFEGCTRTFDNEFSRYKHRKFDHGQPTQPPGAANSAAAGISGGDALIPGSTPPPPALPDDRSYSPMPALVPISHQVPPVPSGSSPSSAATSNSNYSLAAAAMLNLSNAHHQSASSSYPHHLPNPNYSSHSVHQHQSSALSPSRSLVLPPNSTSFPTMIPVTGPPAGSTPSNMVANNTSSGHSSPSSSSRRLSNSSLNDPLGTSINSSLISILQAPSMAAATANGGVVPGGLAPNANFPSAAHITNPSILEHHPSSSQLVTAPHLHHRQSPQLDLGGVQPPPPSSTVSAPGVEQRRSSSSTGIYSLKLYADKFDKINSPTGDLLYRCRLCSGQYVVRSQVSIVKHLRAHERGEIPPVPPQPPVPTHSFPHMPTSNLVEPPHTSTAATPSEDLIRQQQQQQQQYQLFLLEQQFRQHQLQQQLQQQQQQNQHQQRPRTMSNVSGGSGFSGGSGGDMDDLEDEELDDREISVEEEQQHLQSGEGGAGMTTSTPCTSAEAKRAAASIRKYNCRSKSGLYSLKKHEDDYARSKGPDGYHYKCVNCDEYTTKSQASMVRHIWTHKKQHFRCDNCNEHFENEFSLYKHKKTTHPEMTSQHNRASSKGSKEKREREAAAAAAAAAPSSASTAANQIGLQSAQLPMLPLPDLSHNSFYPANLSNPDNPHQLTSEQLAQQQAVFAWFANAQQQILAMQQMQQMQQQQQQQPPNLGGGESRVVTPPEISNFQPLPPPLPQNPVHMSAQNLAEVVSQIQRNGLNSSSKTEEEEKVEVDATAKQGKSRRALRFKSTHRKPVQIRQNEEEVDDNKAPKDEDSSEEVEVDN